jgi:hypothetical protein
MDTPKKDFFVEEGFQKNRFSALGWPTMSDYRSFFLEPIVGPLLGHCWALRYKYLSEILRMALGSATKVDFCIFSFFRPPAAIDAKNGLIRRKRILGVTPQAPTRRSIATLLA